MKTESFSYYTKSANHIQLSSCVTLMQPLCFVVNSQISVSLLIEAKRAWSSFLSFFFYLSKIYLGVVASQIVSSFSLFSFTLVLIICYYFCPCVNVNLSVYYFDLNLATSPRLAQFPQMKQSPPCSILYLSYKSSNEWVCSCGVCEINMYMSHLSEFCAMWYGSVLQRSAIKSLQFPYDQIYNLRQHSYCEYNLSHSPKTILISPMPSPFCNVSYQIKQVQIFLGLKSPISLGRLFNLNGIISVHQN